MRLRIPCQLRRPRGADRDRDARSVSGELPRRAMALVLSGPCSIGRSYGATGSWHAAARRPSPWPRWNRRLDGNVRISQVRPLDGFRLELNLTDGSVVERDVAAWLRGPIFETLRAIRRCSTGSSGSRDPWPGRTALTCAPTSSSGEGRPCRGGCRSARANRRGVDLRARVGSGRSSGAAQEEGEPEEVRKASAGDARRDGPGRPGTRTTRCRRAIRVYLQVELEWTTSTASSPLALTV